MKRPVRLLRLAQNDLLEIQAYIVRENPPAAERLVNAILDRLASRETTPMRGAIPRDPRLRKAGYRYLRHREYLILYKMLPSQVCVYRVLHGRRLYDRLL